MAVSLFIVASGEARSSVRNGHLHVTKECLPRSWDGCSCWLGWPGRGLAPGGRGPHPHQVGPGLPASLLSGARALRTLRVGNSGEIDNSEAQSCIFFLSLLHVAELVEGRTPAVSPL